ncbi:hypothetical protein BDA99DRAFT_484833 [Phascolomyces articulosus]|uniref:18S rRNA factor 2 n=1 Tax=Phascolomyces articulosus TaxID=60185 RepID=A0AAD5K590_9FUNG|nr:hypothetical protein BDA99DRAFT_484833 [Phascolomyces articulosus]
MPAEQRKPEDLFGLDQEEDRDNDSSNEEQDHEEQDDRFSKRRLRQAQDLFSKKDIESDQDEDDDDDESESDSDNDVESDGNNVEEDIELPDKEEEEEEEASSDEEEQQRLNDDHAVDKHGNAILDIDENGNDTKKNKKKKVKKLTPEELEAFEKQQKNTGVCYLSRIPMFMSPTRLREFLSQHAELGRIYLEKEDAKITAKRRKFHKNKRVNYREGWVEFKDKKQAKRLAEFLNARQVGGKRGNAFYYETWTIKYLPKFKWRHLTEQMAYERKARERRLEAELAQATRENRLYLENVERAKMHKGMREKRQKKRKHDEANNDNEEVEDIRRSFRQRGKVVSEVASQKAGEGKEAMSRLDDSVKNVLSHVLGK